MTHGRRLTSALLALLLGAVARGEDKPAQPVRGLAGVGLTQAQVDAAIEKGKKALLASMKNTHEAEATWGETDTDVLPIYALSQTDAFTKDRALAQRALAGLYKHEIGKTYETAIVGMALEHLGGRIHRERLTQIAQSLVGQQRAQGSWGYGDLPEAQPPVLSPPELGPDAVIEIAGGQPVQGKGATPTPLKRATEPSEDVGDNSTTQFAVLGIHSAATLGIDSPEDTWKLAVKHYADAQNPDGGWGYTTKDESSYGSMTCAGLTGMAIGLGHTGKDPSADERVKRGLAWLAANFTFEANPRASTNEHIFYYIYGVERVGVLLGTELVGNHEWYPEGAKFLLKNQLADGGWAVPGEGVTDMTVNDTAYALLFLTRATTPLAAAKGGAGTLRTQIAAPVAQAKNATGLLFILDASDSMNAKIGGRSKWEIVREAAKKIVGKLEDSSIVGLRVYGHNPANKYQVDERETELLIPIGKLDRARFAEVVDGVTPKGRTPIAMSFDRCANDLASSPPCRVLLLSDGAETGGGDPVASAKTLAANPKCLGIDCLGFDVVSEPKARAELTEVARVGKGRYTESEDPEILARAGARAGTEYVLLDAKGTELGRGTLGDSRPLPEGEYRIRVTVNDSPYEAALWVNTGNETRAIVHAERAKKP